MLTKRSRIRLTMLGVSLIALGLGAWPVSIVLRKDVSLIGSDKELRPGLGARGAFGNSGSRDLGPDLERPFVKGARDRQ